MKTILSIALLSLMTISAYGLESIGQVVAIVGNATSESKEMGVKQLSIKSPIYSGDIVTTRGQSKIQIMFNDDSIIHQGENSSMTIDEYVYSPNDKENNSTTFGLAKGIFRIITGKITKLNPNRFKVKTKMATIGIRGCDLLFKVGEKEHFVYVIQLHGRENVYVVSSDVNDRKITVLNSGTVISVKRDSAMTERKFNNNEISKIITNISTEQNTKTPINESTSIQENINTIKDDVVIDKVVDNQDTQEEIVEEPQVAEVVQREDADDPVVPIVQVLDSGSGADWSWGIWDDGTLGYGGKFISPIDIETIMHGARQFNLTGTGSSGALIVHNSKNHIVSGSCDINVQIGGNILPNWDGTFDLRNASGDALSFEIYGNIQSGGELSGTHGLYNLTVSGDTFDRGSITDESVSGGLVGEGMANPQKPVSGIVGEYNFSHGDNTKVKGRFGSDLD